MPRLTPYPRGFVLSPRPFEPDVLPEHYQSRRLVGTWHFAHDPLRQPAFSVEEATEKFVLVHGNCYPVGDDPVEDVSAWLLGKVLRSEDDFLDALDVLAGRYVVIVGNRTSAEVYQDAVGARSVYYSRTAELVSSHAHLIHDLVAHAPTPPELLPATATAAWNLSPWDGIHALVPNHVLTVGSWTIRRFFPRRANPYVGWPVDRKLTAIETMWHRQLDALTGQHEDIVVSVTGGADSRVVLALAREHLSAMKGFTYTSGGNKTSRWARMLSQDERIVGQLREVLPMRHEFFARNDGTAPVTPELETLIRRNSYASHGRWLIPHYNRFVSGDDVAHLRGNAFEIGRAYYNPGPDNDTVEAVRALYAKKVAGRDPSTGRPAIHPSQLEHFDEVTATLGYYGELWDYHRLDLFYWEHRCGRWLAEILNETDISFDTLMPVNIRAVLEILLSFGVEDRRQAFAYSELVNRNFPVLNFFGKNDDRNLYEQLRDARRSEPVHSPRAEPAGLQPGLTILDRDGTVLETGVQPDRSDLHLPLEHFSSGRTAVRRVGRDSVDGSLGFTFHSPYTADLARGRFAYRITVSGKVLGEVDGAVWGQPSQVTVHNLSAEDTVEIQVVARASMKRKSWSAASRAHITDLRFTPCMPDGPPTVASSNPYMVRVD